MKGKGVWLLFWGILGGLLLGGAVRLIETRIATAFVTYLNDEVQKACDCSFTTEKVGVTLFNLQASAEGACISAKDGSRFEVGQLTANFSISQIFRRRILLSELILNNAEVDGVLPGSPLYDFIDYLAEPIPPERDHPNRWQLQLQNLFVHGGQLTETRDSVEFRGSGLELSYLRDHTNNFIMQPRLQSVEICEPGGVNCQPLGVAKAFVRIADGMVSINHLAVRHPHAQINADIFIALDKTEAISGTGIIEFEPEYVAVNNVKGQLSGQAAFSGTIDEPIVDLDLSLSPATQLTMGTTTQDLFIFSELFSKITFNLPGESLRATVSELTAHGPHEHIKLVTPLHWTPQSITGELQAQLKAWRYGQISITSEQAELQINGSGSSPAIRALGKVNLQVLNERQLPTIQFDASQNGSSASFKLSHRSPTQGVVSAQGALDWSETQLVLKELVFDAEALALAGLPSKSIEPLLLSGRGQLHGPLQLQQLIGEADFKLTSRQFAGESALRGALVLKEGNTNLKVYNDSRSLKISLGAPLSEPETGHLRIVLQRFRPEEYDPRLRCLSLSADLNYDFDFNSPATGKGKLSIGEVALGCGSYTIQLNQPEVVDITNGNLTFNQLELTGNKSKLAMTGSLNLTKNLDLKVTGGLECNALLPFFPEIDDLKGQVDLVIKLTGPLAEPEVSGSAIIDKVEVVSASAGLNISDTSGKVRIAGSQLEVENLYGRTNGGTFNLDGAINVRDLTQSEFNINLSQVLFEPTTDASLMISGFATFSGRPEPLLSGAISIDSGYYEQRIDVGRALALVRNMLITNTEVTPKAGAVFPVELDLVISNQRDFYIVSNFLEAELRSDLRLAGTLDKPIIQGGIETLSGWVGIKDRRFEITSGQVIFEPRSAVPRLDVIAETYLYSPTGDLAYVILEVRGPLSDPRVQFFSDRGLTQPEIVNLLATGSAAALSGTSVTTHHNGLGLVDDHEQGLLDRLLSEIMTIDRLSVETALNPQTGLVEPQVVAEKELLDNLTLVGRTFFSDATQGELIYNVTQDLSAVAVIDNANAQEKSAVEANLTATLLHAQKDFLAIEIEGNKHINGRDIRRGIRLQSSSRVLPEGLPGIKQELEQFYRQQAFPNAQVTVICSEIQTYCRQLRLTVDEGNEAIISEVELAGSLPSNVLNWNTFASAAKERPATELRRRTLQDELIRRLRSEGYISARIEARYETISKERQKLVFDCHLGVPVTFNFVGNTIFSPTDFLATINLLQRRQPFGPNTISILIENIERLYRHIGYLYASIDYEQINTTDSERIQYQITIREEQQVKVKAIRFEGDDTLTPEQLAAVVAKNYRGRYGELFNPKYAIAEQLELNCELLLEIYREHGFPNPTANARIEPVLNRNLVNIVYNITTGTPQLTSELDVTGMPSGVSLPEFPTLPLSIPEMNRFSSALLETLQRNGYPKASLGSSFNPRTNGLLLEIDPGQPVTIESVKIEGLDRVSRHTVANQLTFQPGQVWQQESLDESRRKLLQLGLFSRVEIIPADGLVDSAREGIVVRVFERPLQTLEVGGGANSELGAHIFGQATDKSIFGDGQSISLRTDVYYEPTTNDVTQGIASLRYFQPDILNSDFKLASDLRFQRLDLATLPYDLDRLLLETSLFNFSENGNSILFNYTLLEDNLDQVEPDVVLSNLDSDHVYLSFLSGDLTFDRRNQPINPERGYLIMFDYRLSSELIGSEANYYSLGGRFTYLHPLLDSRFTIANNTRLALTRTFGNTSQVPITQRYFTGGRSSVRGFRENSLGPQGVNGNVIGGDALFVNNLELRYRWRDYLSTHVFLDAGTTYLHDRSINLDDLRVSSGVGFRLVSPIGPIGFDLGIPLDERSGEPSLRLHFTIGSNF